MIFELLIVLVFSPVFIHMIKSLLYCSFLSPFLLMLLNSTFFSSVMEKAFFKKKYNPDNRLRLPELGHEMISFLLEVNRGQEARSSEFTASSSEN